MDFNSISHPAYSGLPPHEWQQFSQEVHGEMHGVHFSLVASHVLNPNVARSTVKGMDGLQLATPHEIMSGKMLHRWPSYLSASRRIKDPITQVIPSRDLYDLAVCNLLDPQVATDIVNHMSANLAHRLGGYLASMPADVSLHEPADRHVAHPAYQVNMVGIAHKVAVAVAERDASKIPSADPKNIDCEPLHPSSGDQGLSP